jgi:imidazolonepropionase-like amidohydrolase
MRWLLRPSRCVDGDGSALPAGTELLVADGLIACVGAALPTQDAVVLDLPGQTLLPGFLDLHEYLSVDPDRPNPMAQIHDTDLTLRRAVAVRHLARDLAAGVTTLRTMGEGGFLDVRLRDAPMMGPRLICSGTPIAAPGTHQAGPEGGHATPDDVARAVDIQAAGGVDWIKLVPTGGALGGKVGPDESPWSRAHLRAAMGRARMHGLPVAVAAHGGPIVSIAAEEGAATLEHGAWLDEAALDAVAANGVALVPTLGRFLRPDGMALAAAATPAERTRLQAACANIQRWVPLAVRRGIPMGLGGDNMHGRQAWDATELVRLGASPSQAVAALTGAAARICRLSDRGFLRQGRLADIVAVDGDPLLDPNALQRVRAVMCRGRFLSLIS